MALFGRETERDERRAQEWGDWLRAQNPFAIVSLVLGVFSLIEFGALIVFGVAGIVAGVIALGQLRRNVYPSRPRGGRLAWGGIITSAASLVVAAFIYLSRIGSGSAG